MSCTTNTCARQDFCKHFHIDNLWNELKSWIWSNGICFSSQDTKGIFQPVYQVPIGCRVRLVPDEDQLCPQRLVSCGFCWSKTPTSIESTHKFYSRHLFFILQLTTSDTNVIFQPRLSNLWSRILPSNPNSVTRRASKRVVFGACTSSMISVLNSSQLSSVHPTRGAVSVVWYNFTSTTSCHHLNFNSLDQSYYY